MCQYLPGRPEQAKQRPGGRRDTGALGFPQRIVKLLAVEQRAQPHIRSVAVNGFDLDLVAWER